MKRAIARLVLFFTLLVAAGCSKPTTEMVFSTSTEGYPITSDADALALAAIGGGSSGLAVTSLVRIPMQGLGDAKVQALWLDALVLRADEGELRFIQFAKCYVQARAQGGQPVLVGTAKAEDASGDGKSMKFHVESGVELSGILKSPFNIAVVVEGDAPTGKVSVSAELKLKARISL